MHLLLVELHRHCSPKCIFPNPEFVFAYIFSQKQGSGYVNQMLVYRQRSDVDKEDAIIVRVFGGIAGLANKEQEVASMQVNKVISHSGYTHRMFIFSFIL